MRLVSVAKLLVASFINSVLFCQCEDLRYNRQSTPFILSRRGDLICLSVFLSCFVFLTTLFHCLSLSDWQVGTWQHLSTQRVDRSTLFSSVGWLATTGFRPIQTRPSHIGIQSIGSGWFRRSEGAWVSGPKRRGGCKSGWLSISGLDRNSV